MYDGVIVRSPFYLIEKNPFTGEVVGEFLNDVPFPVKMAQITDGASKTIMIGEKYIRQDLYLFGGPSDDTGWSDAWDPDVIRCTCVPPLNDSQTNGSLTGKMGTTGAPWWVWVMGSPHSGGFNAVFADGSVHTINYNIDLYVFNALGTRNGTSAGRDGPASPEVIVDGTF